MSQTTPAITTGPRIYGHHINGVEVSSTGALIERVNPANGILVARFADGDRVDVEAAVVAAREAFDHGPWPSLTGAERSRHLLALAAAIRDERERLATIDALEVGKPIRLARGDVDGAVAHIEYAAALAHEVRGDAYTNLGPDHLGLVIREPVGVAGLIVPWNFPALSFGEKVPYALAAGCTVVLKPSEFTSGSAVEMARLATEAGIPNGVINVVTGLGSRVGQALVESPGVDLISFTGSTKTGALVAASAAATHKRVALELGGKSATIVFADADLEQAVESALFAVFFNTGECCVAGSRLLVQDSVADEFLALLVARTEQLKVGSPLDEEADLGALIHDQHAAKVLDYIEGAVSDGARLLTGGHRLNGDLASGSFVEPTIFDNVHTGMQIYREEIFGPVLSVSRFTDVDHAIEWANDTVYGLANTVWTRDLDTALTVSRALRSGTVWVNTTLDSAPQMPFGGVKASGYGRDMGRAGLEEFTVLKSLVVRTGQHTPFFA